MLYVLDVSEQCGHSLAQQAALFHSIKPLFANKPLLVVANKVDVTQLDSLAPADKALIDEMVSEAARMSGAPNSFYQLHQAPCADKPLLLVANKVDMTQLDSLSPASKALIDRMITDGTLVICVYNNNLVKRNVCT